jgi:hypothetical protein
MSDESKINTLQKLQDDAMEDERERCMTMHKKYIGKAVSFNDVSGRVMVGIVVDAYKRHGEVTFSIAVSQFGLRECEVSACLPWHGDIPENGQPCGSVRRENRL